MKNEPWNEEMADMLYYATKYSGNVSLLLEGLELF